MSDQAATAGRFGSTCPKCGLRRKWESLIDRATREERWLTICECGHMDALVPGESENVSLEDPLSAYLFGTANPRMQEDAPPWTRLFLRTAQEDRPLRWRYVRQSCPGCFGNGAQLAMMAYPRLDVFGSCSLCLSCGYVTASYSFATRDTMSHLGGADWTPACPAVKRLRDCALRPYMALYINGWGSPPGVGYSDGEWDSFFGQWEPFT